MINYIHLNDEQYDYLLELVKKDYEFQESMIKIYKNAVEEKRLIKKK